MLDGGAAYNTSGAAIIGLAEVVDSLCAVRELVFDTKECTFTELIAALRDNWKDHEKLQLKAINSGNKFGTDSELAAETADFLIDMLNKGYKRRKNYRGGNYTVGYWTMTTHAGWGLLTGAMPSGRKERDVLPSGITPVSGKAPALNEALRFIARLDSKKMANSHALNLKYTPASAPAEIVPKFAASVDAYMDLGGMQVQFNLIDRATLEEARAHPERHPNLLVRVSGYTAYFADLNPYMQEEIIVRAEYDLNTGKEVR